MDGQNFPEPWSLTGIAHGYPIFDGNGRVLGGPMTPSLTLDSGSASLGGPAIDIDSVLAQMSSNSFLSKDNCSK
jgi:hypothetical protein